jgi:hypothetical protein
VLNLSSFAHIFTEDDGFEDPDKRTELNLKIADVLYTGMPVRKFFYLVTTMNYGSGRRRIPVHALLSGELSPVVETSYEIELHFTEELKVTSMPVSNHENKELQDNETIAHNDIQLKIFLEQSIFHSAYFEKMKNWKAL